ncbi:hypothetical protein RHMOL_Rhmol06G0008300 [Rhododendron molle]|uniref:Uncharacterized protein n=1 Tax=Rhododendron molle TaxID=49168 RepID=A0ACC0N7G5_RHOML|nr:hypothetical protein RHMOL_Rhmol06G0008300 [Rhododendron molle]
MSRERRAVAGGGNGTRWLSVELAACLGWKLINKGRRVPIVGSEASEGFGDVSLHLLRMIPSGPSPTVSLH